MSSGIVCLRNLKTDKVYLFYANDIQKENADMRFKLDLGLHPCRELQDDYAETGLEVFRFDTIELTDDRSKLDIIKKQFDKQYRS